ncbi:mechanosensitive ion channel domain-containing protein [Candidatus Latescibacterota bacterium]
MMEVMDFRFSELAFLRAVAVGILMLAVFRLLYMGLNRLARRRRSRLPLMRSLPLLEAATGLLYVVWALGSVLERGLYYNAALFMVLAIAALLLTWFAARDWVAGIILKVEDAYELGQRLRCGEVEGTIRSVGHLSVEVELAHGERVKIPYSRVSGQMRALMSGDAPREHHRFQIDVEGPIEAAAAARRLRETIINSAWSALDREPQIRVVEEGQTHTVLEAVVYAPGAAQAESLERDVRAQCGAPWRGAGEPGPGLATTAREV